MERVAAFNKYIILDDQGNPFGYKNISDAEESKDTYNEAIPKMVFSQKAIAGVFVGKSFVDSIIKYLKKGKPILLGIDVQLLYEKQASLTASLDKIAGELESKGNLKLAYEIDKISDRLEKSSGIGQDIKKLLSEGWKWIKSKVVDEPNAEKVLKEYGVEWDKKEKVPAGYPGSGNVEYIYKNESRPVAVWDVIRKQVLVPDRYWGNPVKINKKDVEYYNKPGE